MFPGDSDPADNKRRMCSNLGQSSEKNQLGFPSPPQSAQCDLHIAAADKNHDVAPAGEFQHGAEGSVGAAGTVGRVGWVPVGMTWRLAAGKWDQRRSLLLKHVWKDLQRDSPHHLTW